MRVSDLAASRPHHGTLIASDCPREVLTMIAQTINNRPWVIAQTEISLDGAIEGFELHMGAYYGVAAGLGADAELIGSATMLAAPTEDRPETSDLCRKPAARKDESRHTWFVPDSQGRVRNLHHFRDTEWCRDLVLLISETTPASYRDYLEERQYDYIVAGRDRVDLSLALGEVKRRYGVNVLRVDSGGDLVVAMLKAGLVDEISLLLAPVLAGVDQRRMFRSLDGTGTPISLDLRAVEQLPSGLLHLRYTVLHT